jgi:hypothetical protein
LRKGGDSGHIYHAIGCITEPISLDEICPIFV